MRFYKIILLVLISFSIVAQPKSYPSIAAPLEGPLTLSGTFCELRNSHFHGGIDLRTNGEEGLKIFSVEDGFVSRVRVSGSGYGKALYIDHVNGYTSVYGHLQKFSPEIEEWLKKVHVATECSEIDTLLPKNLIKVKRSQWVAVSGNTGASQAPHLHFEMRETDTEAPVNPKLFGLFIIDNVPPYPGQLMLQAFDNEDAFSNIIKQKLIKKGTVFSPVKDTIKVNAQKIGLSIFTEDKMEGSENSNGIYELSLKVNDKIIYGFNFEKLSSFDDVRKIAGHMEHRTHKETGARFHRCYKLPGNYLPIYNNVKNNGIINIEHGEIKKVEISAYDLCKNKASIVLYLLGDTTTGLFNFQKKPFQKIYSYQRKNYYEANGIDIDFKDSTFYNNVYFSYSVAQPSATSKIFSLIHQVNTDLEPCQREFNITINTINFPDSLKHKAIAIRENSKGNRAPLYGEWNGDETFTFKSKEFGKFYISIDTTPPAITPVNIYLNKLMKSENSVRFKISDNLTGINKFDIYIDGKWALAEYDAKRSLVWHTFDKTLEQGTHDIVFVVKDRMNNIQTFKTKFRR